MYLSIHVGCVLHLTWYSAPKGPGYCSAPQALIIPWLRGLWTCGEGKKGGHEKGPTAVLYAYPGEHVLGTHWRRCPAVRNALGCQINVHATNWNQDERLAEGLILQNESPRMFPYRPFEILDNLHKVCGEGQGERVLAASQHMFHTAKQSCLQEQMDAVYTT